MFIIGDLFFVETRIHQRRKDLEEIRQKSNRFNQSIVHLQSDADRLLHMIEKAPDVRISFRSETQEIVVCSIECGDIGIGNRFDFLCVAISRKRFEEIIGYIQFVGYRSRIEGYG